jgi:hypothetical protein
VFDRFIDSELTLLLRRSRILRDEYLSIFCGEIVFQIIFYQLLLSGQNSISRFRIRQKQLLNPLPLVIINSSQQILPQ